MKIFHCNHCGHLIYFENTSCLNCGNVLAYLPDQAELCSLDGDGRGHWRVPGGENQASESAYKLCGNYVNHNVCNWAVRADDPDPYCVSCRLNETIPNLAIPGNQVLWAKIEAAKRRLVYSLLMLNLPVVNRVSDPENGLSFKFLADEPNAPVLTGHDFGVITINIAEADDAEREKRRLAMHEPYRTLMGHFRHEVGHYYWDRIIKDTELLMPCRQVFGDESIDYDEALRIHYSQGVPANWQESYISEYATTHAWEDWAETWAHYLHMSDALETAVACGLSLSPERADEPSLTPEQVAAATNFDQMIESWYPLTYLLNNLNRGLGLADGYPFVISAPVVQKLHFIHDAIAAATRSNPTERTQDLAPV